MPELQVKRENLHKVGSSRYILVDHVLALGDVFVL